MNAFLADDARAGDDLRKTTRELHLGSAVRDRDDVARTGLLDDISTCKIAPARHDFFRRNFAHDSRNMLDFDHFLALDSAFARFFLLILARNFRGRPDASAIV